MPFGLRADNRGRPFAAKLSLNGATLYVLDADLGSHIVTPVRTASNTAGTPINLHGGVADFIAFDPSR
jgi:hypothetical protein